MGNPTQTGIRTFLHRLAAVCRRLCGGGLIEPLPQSGAGGHAVEIEGVLEESIGAHLLNVIAVIFPLD